MKQFISWVHGNAAVAEWMGNPPLQSALDIRDSSDPSKPQSDLVAAYSEVNGWRSAWGAFFTLAPNAENWFHIPIPTPQHVEDRQAGLDRVIALFRIDNGFLNRVLVFDGPNQILDRSGLAVEGDHSGGGLVDDANVFHVDHDGINWGVCFSLNFKALGTQQGQGGLIWGANLYIASAGGIFFHAI
jgi:hypothetical protein